MPLDILSVLLKDGYKVGHHMQYPSDTTEVYSNLTPRSGSKRNDCADGVVFFGLQYFILEYLIDHFNKHFFDLPHDVVMDRYKRRINNYLGPDAITFEHISELHELGYLPLKIKALKEGTLTPYGVPMFTIVNTLPGFYWLTNSLETVMSSVIWKACTSATTAMHYRRTFEQYAERTGADRAFIDWQGHDFSFRGMCGVEDAAVSGAGHLLSFTGTDTIPAIDFLEQYYQGDSDNELIGGSVAATEHSVMCMGLPECEVDTFRRLLTEVYPTGIVSIVSDTWDLWKVLRDYLPALKPEIMARQGKLVIRPDSGDPVKIICGDPKAPYMSPEYKGAMELLWETFGGTYTDNSYRLLDEHVGLIYGDGISPARQSQILGSLARNDFASSNVVLGLGSYTYQYVTRDTDGFAMKATAGRTVSRGLIEIFKDPITDDGTKRSAKGLLYVGLDAKGQIMLEQCVTPERESQGLLELVFMDGVLKRTQSLKEIRSIVRSYT